MRIVTSIGAFVLTLVGCGHEDTPEAWDPSTSTGGESSGDPSSPDPVTTTTTTTTAAATTDAGDTSSTTSDASSSDDGIDEPPADLPPAELPLPQAFELPFVCGDAWRLDSWGHAPALDMVREPDQHGTEGAPLHAPAAGVVNQSFFHDNAGNTVQIDHGEGYFTTFLHMESRAVEVGAVVEKGDVIGAVGRTGPTSNDHPHLHFELGIDANGDGEASWGFEGAERVNPWFGGVEYGQANALTWRDVVSMNCP
jgi:murein DD-endopeptidase MepM/ murein hydrolase activator NlpD